MGSANHKLFTTHGGKVDAISEFAPWASDRSNDDIAAEGAVSKGNVGPPGYKIAGATVRSIGPTDVTEITAADPTAASALGLGSDDAAISGDKHLSASSTITSPLLPNNNIPNQNTLMQLDYEPDANQKFRLSMSYIYLDSSSVENGLTVPDDTGGILGSARPYATESDDAGVQNGTTHFTAALLPDVGNPKDNIAAHHPRCVFYKAETINGKEKKTLLKIVIAGGTAETSARQRGLEESLFDLQMPVDSVTSPTSVSFEWMPGQDVKIKYICKLNPDYANMASTVLKNSHDEDVGGFVDNSVPRPIIEKPTASDSLATVSIPYVPSYTVASIIALDPATLTQ